MKYKAVIFDFDGTIADTIKFTYRKIGEIIDKHHISDKSHQEIIDEIRSKTPEELMKIFKISWLKLPFFLIALRNTQKELYNHLGEIQPYSGIKETLDKLSQSGYRLGILSSNLKQNIDKFLSINSLAYFDFIYCEKNIFGKDKALKNLLKRESLSPEDIIYVGDEARDIEACKKTGIKIIAATWGLNTEDVLLKCKPDYLIHKPAEITRILQTK